ncbi:MAG: hypothetical protein M1839_004584 [Geoglossum umbratile]|nr:MAG: hypothetical protein M1839_004584 [Geoglossum umbratile]
MPPTLRIPPCGETPAHSHHPPSLDKPLRIAVGAPVPIARKLFPDAEITHDYDEPFSAQEVGDRLAKLAFFRLYGRDPDPSQVGDYVVRTAGFLQPQVVESEDQVYLDTFFDHLVPPEESNPEVLQLRIVDPRDPSSIDKLSKIAISEDVFENCFVALPLCCQKGNRSHVRASVNATSILFYIQIVSIAKANREHTELGGC